MPHGHEKGFRVSGLGLPRFATRDQNVVGMCFVNEARDFGFRVFGFRVPGLGFRV